MKGLDRLLELQQLDLSVDRVVARREELEAGEEVAAARARVEELESQLGELRLALDAVVTEQTRLESDAGMLEQKRVAEEKRLYDGSVVNPKELEAIQAEVANLKQRQARYEDGILEQMERREALEARVPVLEADLDAARAGLTEAQASSEQELREIAKTLEERGAEREGMVPAFDGELLDLYEDLRSSKKGVGAAALVDGVCQGCHQKLSPVEIDRLKKSEGLRRCDYCRRILLLT